MSALAPDTVVERRGLDLAGFLRVARTYWVSATIAALLCVSAAGLWTAVQTRVWTSEASGVVRATSGSDAGLALAADSLAKSKAKTYLELAKSNTVAQSAAAALGDDTPAATLLPAVTASAADDSSIIVVSAHAESAERAQAIAAAWITAMTAEVKALENPDNQISTQSTSFVPLAAATLPTAPTSPNTVAALTVGLLAGILAAGILLMVRHSLDRRIRSSDVVETLTGAPVVGSIVDYNGFDPAHRLVTQVTPLSGPDRRTHFAITEGLRQLRTNLSYVDVDNPPNSILLVSALPSEGKSTIAANLADTIALSGRRVVLIDCDLRRPTQAQIFHNENAAGLTDVLSGRATIVDVAQPVSHRPELVLIAAGSVPPNPSELLGSRAMRDLVATLVSTGALVILDAPPVLSVTDGGVLSAIVDATFLVVDISTAKQEPLARAVQNVNKAGGHLSGAIINRVPERGPDSHSYGYYRNAYYAKPDDASGTRPAPPSAIPASTRSEAGGGRAARRRSSTA